MYTYYGGLAILVPLVAGLYIARRKEVNYYEYQYQEFKAKHYRRVSNFGQEIAAAKLHVDAER